MLDILYKAHKANDDRYASKNSYQVPVTLTWNQIFSFLSPSLIVENSEENLLSLLGDCIYVNCHEERPKNHYRSI
jgi:hypothetical protein